MTKFSPELFMAEFLSRLKEEFVESRHWWGGAPYVSTSKIALEICREYHYPIWASRDQINGLVNEWYKCLPQGPSFTKILFDRPTVPSSAMGASFVSIGSASHGLKSQDFINFLSPDWGKTEKC